MSKKNSGKAVTKAVDFKGPKRLAEFLKDYKVYQELTPKLDRLSGPFTQETINEIVLWKVARYAALPDPVLSGLGELRDLRPGDEESAYSLFERLLPIKGVGLSMASTFFRFANPTVFQIFDRHVYRALYGKLPRPPSKKPEVCWPIYKMFLAKLRSDCKRLKIPFEYSDRILFEYDKAVNPPLTETP